MPSMNVESFNLDHRKVDAPYIRVADVKTLPKGDVLTKYDIRFCQPNEEHLDMKTVHSIEHTFAELSRNHSDSVVDFSPMGCQTGFYLIMIGEPAEDEIRNLVADTLTDLVTADEVPAANVVQCGWGENHSLEGAKLAAQAMLDKRDEWARVMKD
ncbi:MAG: S-ribosylhomocysteine lyase [Flaviflexus sp.]|uniref:S-ribosylhomocysteine lyase n=1 Tax=Flaviflexus sp. TaxID=1969482 RepID=UPI00352CCBD1